MDRDVERVVEAVHAVMDVTGTDSVQALIAAQDVLEARIADAVRELDREGAVLDDGAAVNRIGGGTARPAPGRSGWRTRPS